jgi:hypothetical protein
VDVPKSAVLFTHKISPGMADMHKSEQEYSVLCAASAAVRMHNIGGASGKKLYEYFQSKGLTGEHGSQKPASKVEPKITLLMKSNSQDTAKHIAESGGKVLNSVGSVHTVEVLAKDAASFAERFTNTGSFDASVNTKAGMKHWVEDKAQTAILDAAKPAYSGFPSKKEQEWQAPAPAKPLTISSTAERVQPPAKQLKAQAEPAAPKSSGESSSATPKKKGELPPALKKYFAEKAAQKAAQKAEHAGPTLPPPEKKKGGPPMGEHPPALKKYFEEKKAAKEAAAATAPPAPPKKTGGPPKGAMPSGLAKYFAAKKAAKEKG